MARINHVAFEGVQQRALSRHLRANGCKVTAAGTDNLLTVRSDKSPEQLVQLAHQLPGCHAFIAQTTR